MPADKRTPVCKVSVGGSPLESSSAARLVRASVDLDADLLAQTTLLFIDPEMELINGSLFESGKSVELKMGYDSKPTSVFFGEVVRLEPQFRRDEPVALKVVCQDSLHRLALTPMTRTFNDADLSSVVTSIAQEHGLSADAPSGTKQHILQNNVTDAEFLRRFAMRMGLRLFLDGKKLTMGPLPDTSPITLALEDGVKKLKVKRSAKGQVSEISVHGWDEKAKQEVIGKAQPQGSIGKGATDYGDGTLSDSSGDLLPPDVSTAEGIAKGRMKKIAEGFATLEAELIGDSRLLPGQIVEFDKLGAGTDGSYRIDRAQHLFSKHGYYVRFDAVYQGPKTSPAPPKPAQQPYTPPKPVEKGRLTRPRWKRRSSGGSDVADMNVDANKALEGKSVTFILETKTSGKWKEVARADGTVSNGFATATKNLEAPAPADVISQPKWTAAKDSKHEHGQKGEVSVETKLQKPHDIRLIVEQQRMSGRIWDKIAEQTVKGASGGTVKASFDLAHPSADEAAKDHSELLKKPSWNQKPGGKDKPGMLSVEAPGLEDGRKVRLIAERLGRDGKWAAIKTVEAKVLSGVAAAPVDLWHTIEKQPLPNSKLLAAPRWEKADVGHGEAGKLSVEAKDLDGQRVRFVVERNEGGKWSAVGERVVKVAGGKAETEMPLKHPAGKDKVEKIPDAKHDPKTGTASVSAAAYEGRQVRLIAEKKSAGKWVQVGAKTVTVKGGAASAKVGPPHDDSRLGNPKWSAGSVKHGGEVQVAVNAQGLDGSTVEFALERLEAGQWVAAGTAKGKVERGKAAATVTPTHPEAGAKSAKLGAATHDPKTGLASFDAKGLADGRRVRFIVEKETKSGWAKLAAVAGVVKKGAVSAKVTPAHPELTRPAWSTPAAAHGGQVELSVRAKGPDGADVEFALERLEGSNWVPAGTAKGKVQSGKATAKVTLTHPEAGAQSKALGAAKHDPATGQVSIAAKGLDGRKVLFVAEKQTAAGWTKFSSVTGVVEGGAVSGKVGSSTPQLAKPTWSTQAGKHGSEAVVSVLARGGEGSEVEFALERLEGGKWVPAGTAKGKVQSGKATAKVTLAHSSAGKTASKKPTADILRFHAVAVPGNVRVRAELLPNLDPQKLRFSAAVVPVKVRVQAELLPAPDARKLRFRAKLLEGPEMRVRAELQPDSDPRKLRFRAEVVPDMGAQKIRFRAEPLPDLRPRKLRFRAELPVPEHPGLTRMRVELQGGTPDQHVQTGGPSGGDA